jgi:hypothetical protein
VIAAQAANIPRHEQIISWLTYPSTLPADSFGVAMDSISNSWTVFPRRASWTTMVTSGQLTALNDPALVNRLANLYEHLNRRIEYNGAVYDEVIEDLLRNSFPYVWDLVDGSFLTSDTSGIRTFRAQVALLQYWNEYYYGLVVEWREELDRVIVMIDSHLGEGVNSAPDG